MRLWIESAHQTLSDAGVEKPGDAIRTFTSEDQFIGILVSGAMIGGDAAQAIATRAVDLLAQETPLGGVVETLLASLPQGAHAPFSILQVGRSSVVGRRSALLVECDAPPLFMTRKGRLVLLPVIEEESHRRLIRKCEFALQDGDHVAMVSEGYIRAKGWSRRWGWRDIAIAIRRLTETRCDAEQLAGALMRTYERLTGGGVPVTILAMFVRPMRTATVWSGPPANRALEKKALEELMAEPGTRVICGDTTAEIAARLSGAELVMEPRPEDGWMEVPPVSRLAGVDLVTEGLVTIGKARERLAGVRRARDLPRQEDGATRLARMLLTADKIRCLVGLAVNPAQTTADGTPMRRIAIEKLLDDLEARGKIVAAEFF